MSDDDLAEQIRASSEDSDVDTTIKTSQRVLARVTDGIYRQPGSALRELISNAYDADASSVVIQTDRPRFKTISVADDGAGMSPEALAHLLENIGGSAKRRHAGAELGVTAKNDPLRSPGGRRLIGRIGIGLFSVSQLTQAFQITTKVQDDKHRTIATVVLKQYGEEAGAGTGEDGDYEAGRVKIWREPAADVESHGTTITLTAIRPQTQRTLQNDAVWKAIEAAEKEGIDGEAPVPPEHHIGRVRPGTRDELREQPDASFASVPWNKGDAPREAFKVLVDAVWQSVRNSSVNPKLSLLFDDYLQMVWRLALSVPLPYVEGHPFDIAFDQKDVVAFELASSGAVSPIELGEGQTLAKACDLRTQKLNTDTPFRVVVDDLELTRPLRFQHLPKTSHKLTRSILMVAKCRETFENVPIELSGGPLGFEAYLLWNPKIAPSEHQGSLIRIHGASGTLFDPSFMRYQVAEQTRRTQISCEIFVSEGLEGALNIDREAFNYAHPQVVFLTNWLHQALRALATTQKRLASEVRKTERASRQAEQVGNLERIEQDSWIAATADNDVVPPVVEFREAGEPEARPKSESVADTGRDRFVVDADRMRLPRGRSQHDQLTERRLAAIASILLAHGVADLLTREQFHELLEAVSRVLQVDET